MKLCSGEIIIHAYHLGFWEGGSELMVGHSREGGKGVREGGSRREHPQAVHGHQVLQTDRAIEIKIKIFLS